MLDQQAAIVLGVGGAVALVLLAASSCKLARAQGSGESKEAEKATNFTLWANLSPVVVLLISLALLLIDLYVSGERLEVSQQVTVLIMLSALITSLIRIVRALFPNHRWTDVQEFRIAFLPERTLSFAFVFLMAIGTLAVTVAKERGVNLGEVGTPVSNEVLAWIISLLFFNPLQQAFVDVRGEIKQNGLNFRNEDVRETTVVVRHSKLSPRSAFSLGAIMLGFFSVAATVKCLRGPAHQITAAALDKNAHSLYED